MTQIKQAKIRSFQPIVLQSLVVVIGFLALIAISQQWISFVAGIVAFGVVLLLAILVSHFWMRSFKCPECGNSLMSPHGWWYRFPGATILFRCEQCDTDWDFGVKGQED